MLEVAGDIWDYYGKAFIVVTTYGFVTKTGRAIFGNGVAGQAIIRFPWLGEKLGEQFREQGQPDYFLGRCTA